MSINDEHTGRALLNAWVGKPGFERLLARMDVRVAEPSRFRAEERRLEIDGITLVDWRSSPMTVLRHAQPGSEAQSLAMLLVASGRVRVAREDQAFERGSGSLFVISGSDRTRIDLLEASHVLVVRLPYSQLPAPVRLGQAVQSGVIEPSVFTPGFITLLGSLLGRQEVQAPSLHGVVALRALATAVLTEQLPPGAGDMESLRRRMILHIELHLADPDLGPRSIAGAFGVSLRWVHMVFNTGDVSVARFIRECRVDAIAAAVRSDLRLTRVSSLATAYGFAGRDQLNRSFRARYGMSVHEYQELASRGETLPAPIHEGGADSKELVSSRSA